MTDETVVTWGLDMTSEDVHGATGHVGRLVFSEPSRNMKRFTPVKFCRGKGHCGVCTAVIGLVILGQPVSAPTPRRNSTFICHREKVLNQLK